MSDKSNAVVIGVIAGIAALMFSKKSVPPGSSTLTGRVTDAVTGAGIAGAAVSLGSLSTSADGDGNFTFTNIATGSYPLTITKSGYGDVSMSVTILAGSNSLNFEMTPSVVPPTKGTLTGQVTDATTGQPINGVTVSLSGVTTTTDSGGNYGFTNITPGTYTLTFTKSGYNTLTV